MAYKQFQLDDGQNITIYKRRASRSLRLTISPKGEVKVSIPAWAPYKAGIEFARSKQAWIASQATTANTLKDGQAIGKAHHLKFVLNDTKLKPASRITKNNIVINYTSKYQSTSPEVQKLAETAAIRALRAQAEQLLPQRLRTLADQHDLSYARVDIKQLKGRWGSCDQHSNIVLNLFLMQLPWELIDYVLLHELTHTVVLRHGPDFWQTLEKLVDNPKGLRTSLRQYQPVL